jgi:hypothetical protein
MDRRSSSSGTPSFFDQDAYAARLKSDPHVKVQKTVREVSLRKMIC